MFMKMKRSKSEVFGVRRFKLLRIFLGITAIYSIVAYFKFSEFFEFATVVSDDDDLYVGLKLDRGNADEEKISNYQGEGSEYFVGSLYKDSIRKTLENEYDQNGMSMPRKEALEYGSDVAPEKPSLHYGRLTGKIFWQLDQTLNMTLLEKMVDEAWALGSKAWKDVEKYDVKDNTRLNFIIEGKQESCPSWVSASGEELTKEGRVMFLPCGLSAGSSITVVGTPHYAHHEYVPELEKLRNVDPMVLVSQFMVELQGLKAVVGEDPPKILHLNPRLRGDWSHRPVIEHNTCYRMQWGTAQRCDGMPSNSDDNMLVDEFSRCEKWMGTDIVDSKESRTASWFKGFIGRAQKPEVTWPFPFVEGKLFVLTLRAGVDGYHIFVGGRHISSFPYRTGFTLEDATGLSFNGNVDIHSVFATSLPTSHPSFSPQKVLEMLPKWKSLPLPSGPIRLFIGVLSATNHFAERMAIRKTWMQASAIKSSNVVLRFFVALNPRKEVNEVLRQEAAYFGDIVILPFMDRYELVVLKTIAICDYGVQNATAAYIMKCDDDTFVRVDTVFNELEKVSPQKSLYMGNLNILHTPLRTGKWGVSFEEWPEAVYPPYANGPGYIISSDIAKFVFSQHVNRTLRLFKMEDVSMGMWVERFNSSTPVKYSHSWKFCQYGCIDNYYTAHYQSPRQMLCLWDYLARGQAHCCNFR